MFTSTSFDIDDLNLASHKSVLSQEHRAQTGSFELPTYLGVRCSHEPIWAYGT